jgi:hypothetical protein
MRSRWTPFKKRAGCRPARGEPTRFKKAGLLRRAADSQELLSASAMPRATADTLIDSSDSPIILAHGGHGHGHMGGAATIMVGAEVIITIGTNR